MNNKSKKRSQLEQVQYNDQNKTVSDVTMGGKSWILRKLCTHDFFSHKMNNNVYITCVKCGQQYQIEI